MFWVYIIENSKGKRYTGQTSDLVSRLKRHNGEMPSRNNSYTKINKGPWKVIYKEELGTREEAVERERYLKSHTGRDWIKKVVGQ